MNEPNRIELRVCKSWDECVQCEEVQKQVWAMPDFRDVVPASFLYTAAKNGGILVGAFQAHRMVGFAFGVLGSEGTGTARRYKHTSHMLGVLPQVRVQGLGTQMKWFQRRVAMEQGLDLMTWTYDPLQAVNASLNLSRLGAIARRYIRNAYGEMTDALNAGIASDRFEVEWLLAHERVAARAAGQIVAETFGGATSVYEIEWTGQGFARIATEVPLSGDIIRIEIPADISALKGHDMALAADWRERTRATFERAFENGFTACDVLRNTDEAGRARVCYILRRGEF